MRFLSACVWMAMISVQALAADPAKHVVTIDDHFTLGLLGEVAISPSGEWVAYTEGRWQESTDDRKNDLWLVSTATGVQQRVTFDRADYDCLRWSPDGNQLYFASQQKRADASAPYDGTRQVWRRTVKGTEPIPVTSDSDGIEQFVLSHDGTWLIYTRSDNQDTQEWANLRARFPKVKYGTLKSTSTKLYRVDLVNAHTSELAQYAGAIDDLSLSPDGKLVAIAGGPDGSVITMEGKSKISILNLADGKVTDLPDDAWRKNSPSKFGRTGLPRWSADGKVLAFFVGYDGYPSEIFTATFDDQLRADIKRIRRPGDISIHGGVDGGAVLQWRGDSHDLYFLADDHARVRLFVAKDAADGKDEPKAIMTDDVVANTFAWDRAGKRAVASYATREKMNSLYLFDGTAWKLLLQINSHVNDWALPKISIVKWKGANEVSCEGVLELPPDHKPGKPLPMIVNIHGGPTAASTCDMISGFFGNIYFSSQGYAFFSPNYRGSTGYGDSFITDLIGHENEIEVEDILKGVDQLIADGVADKDRIAVSGFSNGGYLTNCLIAKTNRFKAASSGAGISDLIMQWGVSDEPAYTEVFVGGPPWTAVDAYRKGSPILQFSHVKTPTLFHVGEHDLRCPKGQTEMAFRALKHRLNVDTEILTYPGEGHGLAKYGNRKAKFAWESAWFDHYLRGAAKP